MKFDAYPIAESIKKAIKKAGYKKPTDIQYKAIPNILNGEDLLAIAQTGTGKTAAFVIPILHIIDTQKKRDKKRIKKPPSSPVCLVMVPTRELAIQINEVFTGFGEKLKVSNAAIYGGVDQNPQIKKLLKGLDIIVATPGRMFDLVSQKYIKLSGIKILVLDEADHMLDLGFIEDIRQLIKFLPKRRQTLFFSATIDEKIKKLAYSLVHKPVRIQISPKDPVSKNVSHFVIFVEMDHKRFFLERLIKENPDKKILVFVRTQVRAERVKAAMSRVDIHTETIHGGKGQKDRLAAIHNLTTGATQTLIATDVTARGIDIPGIDFVINYDLPEHPDSYVHRVGRTGRARKKGSAFSFCSPDEKKRLKAIEKYIGKEIPQIKIKPEEHREILDLTDEKKMTMDDIVDRIADFEKKKKRRKN